MGRRLVLALALGIAGCGEEPLQPSGPGDMVVVFPEIDLAAAPPPDLVMAKPSPDLAMHQLSFAAPLLLPIYSPRSVVVGDFNEDKKLDIAANDEEDKWVGIFLGDGKGGFAPPILATAGLSTNWIGAGDIDGDGHLDVVNLDEQNASVNFLAGKGNGMLAAARSLYGLVGQQPDQVAVGDVDHDGLDDVAVCVGNDVQIFGNNKLGDLVSKSVTTFAGPIFLTIVDVNGDKRPDLVAGQGVGLQLALGNGDGTFAAPQNILADPIQLIWVAAGDLDGDSTIDLAIVEEHTASIAVSLGDGKGGFKDGPMITPNGMGGFPYADALADFDGDGKLDLAVVGSYQQLFVYPGDGKGGWQAPLSIPAGVDEFSLVVGDFNGDGKPDLAIADGVSSQIEVLLNTST